jgi:uncharacterized protein (TIGR00369 family)
MTATTPGTATGLEPGKSPEPRTRTVVWADPAITGSLAGSIPGLEFLERIARGELPPPPIASLMSFGLSVVERGHIIFTVVPDEYHYNPIGVVHGGLAATLLDSAMGCAVHSLLPSGAAYTTLDLQVRFVRPITIGSGPLECDARVVHSGSRLMTTTGELKDAKGKLYAHATGSCLVLEPRAMKTPNANGSANG